MKKQLLLLSCVAFKMWAPPASDFVRQDASMGSSDENFQRTEEDQAQMRGEEAAQTKKKGPAVVPRKPKQQTEEDPIYLLPMHEQPVHEDQVLWMRMEEGDSMANHPVLWTPMHEDASAPKRQGPPVKSRSKKRATSIQPVTQKEEEALLVPRDRSQNVTEAGVSGKQSTRLPSPKLNPTIAPIEKASHQDRRFGSRSVGSQRSEFGQTAPLNRVRLRVPLPKLMHAEKMPAEDVPVTE